MNLNFFEQGEFTKEETRGELNLNFFEQGEFTMRKDSRGAESQFF
jgi:hypothetical protein